MLRSIRTPFVLLFVFSFSVTLFGRKPATKYFPHSLESLWVYENQDENALIHRAVEGLGYQSASMYRSQGRAAYWAAKNALGEPVASGAYFYPHCWGFYHNPEDVKKK